MSEEDEEATLNFENIFTGGIMIASYRNGAAVLRSDSASTLAIVKELVSKEATARRLNITDSFKVITLATATVVTLCSRGCNRARHTAPIFSFDSCRVPATSRPFSHRAFVSMNGSTRGVAHRTTFPVMDGTDEWC